MAGLRDGSVIWPEAPDAPASQFILGSRSADGGSFLQRLSLEPLPAASPPVAIGGTETLLGFVPETLAALTRDSAPSGLFLNETSTSGGERRTLLSLNAHLADIAWGEQRLIDYETADGRRLQAAVILPHGYRPGERYPTIAWIYPGYRVRGRGGYFLDRHMGGFYNLHLYAARGYVVVIPSIPLQRGGENDDVLFQIAGAVEPAVDRLVELGIAHPGRVGLLGQSLGGYGVYSLVTQTDRFRAAVAIAGITDLAGFYTQFDPSAAGYAGIEHEKSDNWSIISQLGMNRPPWEAAQAYARNSPITHVDRVSTPLLMIHGQYDVRAPMSQAESFFYSLYRRGRTARLLRYWGENHGLSQSPANVRDVFEETVGWFDRYLSAPQPDPPGRE